MSKKTIKNEEIKEITMNSVLYLSYFLDPEKDLEERLQGIFLEARIQNKKAKIRYMPVKNLEYLVQVFNCQASLAKRKKTSTGSSIESIELKQERSKELFEKLVKEMNILLTQSGNYYIKTDKQLDILGDLLTIEFLSKEINLNQKKRLNKKCK